MCFCRVGLQQTKNRYGKNSSSEETYLQMVGGSFISYFIDWRAMGNNTMSKFTMTLCRSTLWHCGTKYHGFLVCRTPIMISGQVSETSLVIYGTLCFSEIVSAAQGGYLVGSMIDFGAKKYKMYC